MSTNILSPVNQPSLMYPSIGVRERMRPRRKDFQCPWCFANLHTQLATIKFSKHTETYRFVCGDCGKTFFRSSRLIINEMMREQLEKMYTFTKKTGKEFGALIIRDNDGIKLDQISVGKEREVEIASHRRLKGDEEILGSIHTHPKTDEPSDWDIATFLTNDWEQVSIVNGVNSTLTVMVKTDVTKKLENIESWINENVNLSLEEKAKKMNFLLYQGEPERLKLIGNQKVIPTSLENLMNSAKGTKNFTEKVKKIKIEKVIE